MLPERESLARLALAGVPVVEVIPAADVDAAIGAAMALGFPVVLKLDVAGLAHKSEAGGVVTQIADAAAAGAAAERLLSLDLPRGAVRRGLLVARQLAGVELIVGGRRDASFGPIVLVGLGGILAEALDDVAVRLAPIRPSDAAAMLRELRGAAILDGFRGRPAVNREALVATIVAIGRLLVDDETVLEVDANPLISGPGGTAAVDALVVQRATDL
jgi:hypothetical protein